MADDIDEIAQALQEAILEGYSEKFKQEFSNPKNIGKIENADSQVSITGVCGDTIEMYLAIKDERIDDIKFMTDGCGATITCVSYVTRMVKGKAITDALLMKPEDVDSYFEGLPDENKHCAKLAIDTLKAASNRYEIKEQKPKIPSVKRKKKGSNAETVIFKDYAMVSCGTLAPELNYLRKEGFLDAKEIVYTTPGRHEALKELASQLIQKINAAKQHCQKIIIVYGGKFCYVNIDNPYRTIDTIIAEQAVGISISRVNATHCIDMLASESQREQISGGQKVWWLTPGWIIYRSRVFQDWDKGKANENFPQHTGGAILLDGIGFWDKYCQEHPEKILEFSDWMGIEIRPHKVGLERLKELLLDCVV